MLNLPDYYDIIKQPMDLGTVKNKMENREYKAPEEFVKDVRLMFTNCYKYNPSDHEIVTMGRKLQNVFEMRLAKMPDEATNDDASSDGGMTSASESESESSSESEDDDESKEKIRLLQAQIQELSKQLSLLANSAAKKIKKKKKKSKSKKEKDYDSRSTRQDDQDLPSRQNANNGAGTSKLSPNVTNLTNNGLSTTDLPLSSTAAGNCVSFVYR